MDTPNTRNRTRECSFPPKDNDTSQILEQLQDQYDRTTSPVEVDFRSLINWIKLGDQLTHQIHPYPAKLLPNIAHFFVRASKIFGPKTRILDPFCGSGTVALEASLAGFTPLVADANPLALLITKAKTTPYIPEVLRAQSHEIYGRSRKIRSAQEVGLVNAKLWYEERIKRELEILRRAMRETVDESTSDFFDVCFSATARRLSYCDPAVSVPVRQRTKEDFTEGRNARIRARMKWIDNATARDEFLKGCLANVNRVEVTNTTAPDRQAAHIVGDDARNLCKADVESEGIESIPLIITSPPYGSAQKYIRASSLSLNWLDLATPRELASFEKKSIGREHVRLDDWLPDFESLPGAFKELIIDINRVNQSRAQIAARFLLEFAASLHEMERVLQPNGHLIIIIGNNTVCGRALRNDIFVTQVLSDLGLQLKLILIDHIKSRGLMTKRNRTASLISRECVLIFKKRVRK